MQTRVPDRLKASNENFYLKVTKGKHEGIYTPKEYHRLTQGMPQEELTILGSQTQEMHRSGDFLTEQ